MNEARWRSLVAQGWTTMLLIFVSNMVMDIVRASVERKLVNWSDHLGPQGIQVVLVVLTIYAVMPLLVRAISGRPFIVVAVMLTFFMGLFVAAHEVSHLTTTRDKPFGILHILDLLHHAVAAFVMYAGIRWFRAVGQRVAAAGGAPAPVAALHGSEAAAR